MEIIFPWNSGLAEIDLEDYVGELLTVAGVPFRITSAEPSRPGLGELGADIRLIVEPVERARPPTIEAADANARSDDRRWLTVHGVRVLAGPGCGPCRRRGYYMGGGGGPLSCPYCGPGAPKS